MSKSYFYAVAEGEIKPYQAVVPGTREGTVRGLRPDEPLIIRGKLNPKILGRGVPDCATELVKVYYDEFQ